MHVGRTGLLVPAAASGGHMCGWKQHLHFPCTMEKPFSVSVITQSARMAIKLMNTTVKHRLYITSRKPLSHKSFTYTSFYPTPPTTLFTHAAFSDPILTRAAYRKVKNMSTIINTAVSLVLISCNERVVTNKSQSICAKMFTYTEIFMNFCVFRGAQILNIYPKQIV